MTFDLFAEINKAHAAYPLPANVVPIKVPSSTQCKHCGFVYIGRRCTVCKLIQEDKP